MAFVEFIKPDINIDFVGKMKLACSISMAMIIITFASIAWHGGLNYGIDFAGGTLIQVKFNVPFTIDKIREAFQPLGIENSIIQQFGPQEIVVRVGEGTTDLKSLSGKVEEKLNNTFGQNAVEMRRVEMVGPKVGKDLTKKALLAIFFSWIGILIYVGFRFEFRYAAGGILALIHDTIITIGAFSLLNKEFDLTIVAALLTIIGYSINDTVVIFDRIRENARKNIKKPLAETINDSINQTLSRTILTAFTVFLVLLSLFFFGGPVIHDFAFALIVGVIVGAYSTVFIASPFVLVWDKWMPSKFRRKK